MAFPRAEISRASRFASREAVEGPSFAQIVHFVVAGAGAGVSTVGFVGSVGW